MSRALSHPPACKILVGRAGCARSELGWPWHSSSYFSYLGWQDFHGPGIIWPELSDFWYYLRNKSKRHQCRGKVLKQKNIEKTLLQEYDFFRNFFASEIFELWAFKKTRSHMTWAVEDRVNCFQKIYSEDEVASSRAGIRGLGGGGGWWPTRTSRAGFQRL